MWQSKFQLVVITGGRAYDHDEYYHQIQIYI